MSLLLSFLPPWLHLLVGLGSLGGLGVAGVLLPNARRILIAVGVALALGFTYYSGYHREHSVMEEKIVALTAANQEAIDKIKEEHRVAVLKADMASGEKTGVLLAKITALDTELDKRKTEYATREKAIRAQVTPTYVLNKDVNGGRNYHVVGGLSISALACSQAIPDSTGRVQASGNTSPDTWPESTVEARLAGKTAEDLISIVTDGDKAIVQLNEVIEAYEAVQAQGCSLVIKK